MFDLEKAIASWRRTFRYRRVFLKEDLDELERHLRDHLAHQTARGLPPEEAFRTAMREVGDYWVAEAEYRKVYWGKVKRRGTLFPELIWRFEMLKNYAKIALRHLLRHPGYTVINVTGMAVGLACCLLILLFVRDELSYDRYHTYADRTFRVSYELSFSGQRAHLTMTPNVIAPLFLREYPEVEQAARLVYQSRINPVVMQYEDRLFQEERFFYADSTIFDVFSYTFLDGDPRTALSRPNTLVLTRSTARKYFGDDDPMGRAVMIDNEREMVVTGIIEDVPSNTHLSFDALGSLVSTHWGRQENWNAAYPYTYVRLRRAEEAAALEAKLPALLERERGPQGAEASVQRALHLQPVTDIRLYSDLEDEPSPPGDIAYVYAFSAIALLILLIACINYMNLATARSARRAREVGMRKMVGAHRGQLVRQFYGESALLTVLALGLAVVLAEIFLPVFNALSGKRLATAYLDEPLLLVGLAGLGMVVTLVAGSYPALFLSSFTPARVLKGAVQAGTGSAVVRKGLVVFQFAVSVFLLIGTAVVYNQLTYVQQKNLGFDKEQVVVLSMGDQATRDRYEALQGELAQHANVLHVSGVSERPGHIEEGRHAEAEGLPEDASVLMRGVVTNHQLLATLGLDLLAGTNLPEQFHEEQERAFLLNEAAVDALGWTVEEAVGKWFQFSGQARRGRVVGVVKNFHFSTLKREIEPLGLYLLPPRYYRYLLVKIGPTDVPETLAFVQAQWRRFAPHRPFDFRFLDQEFDALYRAEQRTGQLFGFFAGLAIVIACLGLFGLASFAAEQRTKEIGVRKALGASVSGIVVLLSKEFARLVLIAFVMAAPIAYFVMSTWLQDFAYRTAISWWTFLIAGALALAVALLTVSYQSIRAALADPVAALRYE